MYTTKKLVIAGDIVSLYEFEKGVLYGGKKIKNTNDTSVEKKKKLNTLDSRQRSFYRAKKKIINLVNSNVWAWKKKNGKAYPPFMYTFTFKDDIRDIKTGNKEFTKFIQRLNYYFTGEKKSFMKYVTVIEFQDLNRDGVIHYHSVFFNLPYIDFWDLKKMWGNGGIEYEELSDYTGMGVYISKYMAKDLADKRLCGQKAYFISRKLKQPIILRNITDIRIIMELLPKPIHQDSYDSEWQGQIDYSQFNLRNAQYSLDDIKKILALRGYSDVE